VGLRDLAFTTGRPSEVELSLVRTTAGAMQIDPDAMMNEMKALSAAKK